MAQTGIEWADWSCNCLRDTRAGRSGWGHHCTKVSPGCLHCYAEPINMRFGNGQRYDGTPVNYDINMDQLHKMAALPAGKVVFLCSMMDFFHPCVMSSQQTQILDYLAESCQHLQVMILTKRPEIMLGALRFYREHGAYTWPDDFDHVWLGITAETDRFLRQRWPHLLQARAAHTFLSLEPFLGRFYMDLTVKEDLPDLVIVGGETGPGARELEPYDVYSVYQFCKDRQIPFMLKSWGEWLDGVRVGKKKTGRLLMGREWNGEVPAL